MKNYISISLSGLALVVALVFGILSLTSKDTKSAKAVTFVSADSTQLAGAIVYVDMDVILAGYDFANEELDKLKVEAETIAKDLEKREAKLIKDRDELQNQINKGLILQVNAEKKAKELETAYNEYMTYSQQKQNEIAEKQYVTTNQITYAIKTYIDEYNSTRGYALILANSAGLPVITGNPALDITEDVLKGLNEEYVKSKKK